MSTARIQVTVPPTVPTPRGSIWAAEAADWLTHKLGAVMRGFGRSFAAADHPRSAQQLLQLAAEVEPEQPALSAELRGIAMHLTALEQPVAPAAPAAQGGL